MFSTKLRCLLQHGLLFNFGSATTTPEKAAYLFSMNSNGMNSPR